ncbi:MAG: deoxynucleoside kinase [Chloroflexi bacterium]|nr:deoxynucleoside kinase [Chloroflexota bacterium]
MAAQRLFVVVAGNIGAGKSTLVGLLAQQFGWRPFYEPEVENPYLADFYRDMRTWAFPSQVFFLTHRLRLHQRIAAHDGPSVQDRSLYEDAEIFAENLYRQGYLAPRDYQTYRALYEALVELLPRPDLVIYVRASVPTLMARIRQRGRAYERHIPEAYVARLNELYDAWARAFTLAPVLTLNADELDWLENPDHRAQIFAQIQTYLAELAARARAEASDIARPS